MLKKLFKKTKPAKNAKVQKLEKKELKSVIGGAESYTTGDGSLTLHRPSTSL